MKTYRIPYKAQYHGEVDVEADTPEEAKDKVESGAHDDEFLTRAVRIDWHVGKPREIRK